MEDSFRKDIDGSVEDLLTDVSSSWKNFQLPTKLRTKMIGDVLAMLEVPETACEAVWSLSHGRVTAR